VDHGHGKSHQVSSISSLAIYFCFARALPSAVLTRINSEFQVKETRINNEQRRVPSSLRALAEQPMHHRKKESCFKALSATSPWAVEFSLGSVFRSTNVRWRCECNPTRIIHYTNKEMACVEPTTDYTKTILGRTN
jgi:hypothetical protein